MTTLEVQSPDARTRDALAYLSPALDDAIATGRPAAVSWVPTSFDIGELVGVAVALCRSRGVNVAVLGNREARGLTFMPLS
jgi:hypothetical protein